MRLIYAVATGVCVIDQASKYFALHFLKDTSGIRVIPGVFHLNFVENTGIAFGLFQNHPSFWQIAITGSVLCLLIYAHWMRVQSSWRRIAYGFILGGAVGNWIDRIRYSHVIDYFDFRVWPVFNIADAFITSGVILLILLSIVPAGEKQQTAQIDSGGAE